MAQGDLRDTLSGSVNSVTNPTNATSGGVTVAVGDLIFGTMSQQTALTASGVTDNLGNTYSAVNAGTDAGNVTIRSFYSLATVAGTLTTVSFAATASTNDASVVVAVIEGPFLVSPLDANPANTTDATSPYTCPATGTLAKANEVIMAAIAVNAATSVAATSPSLLAGIVNRANASVGQSRRKVSATTSVTPEFTGTSATAAQVTASFKLATVIDAEAGTYAITGAAVGLEHGWMVGVDAGSYAVTGTNPSLEFGHVIDGVAGSYSINGATAALARDVPLAAAGGSYSIGGTDATLTAGGGGGLVLNAGDGGTPIGLLVALTRVIDSVYALNGTNAGLEHGWILPANTGSYALNGTDATLTAGAGTVLNAESGAYSVNGTSAALQHGFMLTADAGTYSITGTAAALTHGWSLAAGAGAYTVSGTSATLAHGWALPAAAGSYALGGTDATLTVGTETVLDAESGSYVISGTSTALEHGSMLAAGTGTYSVTGIAAALAHGWALNANNGNYAFIGTAAALEHGCVLMADAGIYALSGADAILSAAGQVVLDADGGAYSLSGSSASVVALRVLIAASEIYLMSGADPILEKTTIRRPSHRSHPIPGSIATAQRPATLSTRLRPVATSIARR